MERIALGLLLNGNAYLGAIGVQLSGLSVEAGLEPMDLATGETIVRREGAWAWGEIDARHVRIGGKTVVGPRQPGIAPPAGGATLDVEARSAIAAILAALTAHGLIEP
jgi:hypothetical protein